MKSVDREARDDAVELLLNWGFCCTADVFASLNTFSNRVLLQLRCWHRQPAWGIAPAPHLVRGRAVRRRRRRRPFWLSNAYIYHKGSAINGNGARVEKKKRKKKKKKKKKKKRARGGGKPAA